MLRLSLCNELLAEEGKSLPEQCAIAAELGYIGLELSPGTLSNTPHCLPPQRIRDIRKTIEDRDLTVTGLHWLLAPYPQLSITDPRCAEETQDVLQGLIELCAALGGTVLVHGSPGQRVPPPGEPEDVTRNRVIDFFRPIADRAKSAGVTYCLEPLSPKETPFINTVAEAAAIVEAVGVDRFRTMIDTSAAGQGEAAPVADLIRHWMPTGLIGHVQVNDTNRGAPGTGEDPFADIVGALRAVGWRQPIAVEPFVRRVDATATAAIGAATMRAFWAATA